MKKICITLYIFSFFVIYTYSQPIEPVTGLQYRDHGRFDSTFRNNYNGIIPSTYFVITLDPTVSALTLATSMDRGYRQIRTFDKNIPLYIVYTNRSVVSNLPDHEKKYFKKIFKIDSDIDTSVYFIQNDNLYNLLNVKADMDKWFYVYNQKLVAGAEPSKLIGLSEYQYNLPRDIIRLGKPSIIKINQGDRFLNIYRDILRPYKPGKLFYITDMENTIHILNVETGEFEKSFDKNTFDYIDYYCKNLALSEKGCQVAKEKLLKDEMNREGLYFRVPQYLNGSIYLTTAFELTMLWEESSLKDHKYYKYKNELGKTVKLKKETTNDYFLALMELDTALNFKNAFIIDATTWPKENQEPNKIIFYSGLDRGFYLNDTAIFFENNPDGYPLRRLAKKDKYKFSVFKRGDKYYYKFSTFLPHLYSNQNYKKYVRNHSRTFYFEMNNNIYAIFSKGGLVEKLNDNFHTTQLKGNGNKLIKEWARPITEDTAWSRFNFRAISANSIYNDRYALCFYFYQDKPTLELLEENSSGNLQTVQVWDLSKHEIFNNIELVIKPSNGDGLIISDNKIYIMQFDKGEYFLYEYPIILKEVQPLLKNY